MLLGGSNSVMTNGLCKGLKDGINRHNKSINAIDLKLEFHNFALGGCTAIQNLYEIIRHKEILLSSELIITESNINELHNYTNYEKMSMELICQQLSWFYKELFFLNKKVLILILTECSNRDDRVRIMINNLHKKFAKKYGFNVIDMHQYFKSKNLQEFGSRYDGGGHQFGFYMREIGMMIIKSIGKFQYLKNMDIVNDNPRFRILTLDNMELISGELNKIDVENTFYKENIIRIDDKVRVKFPADFIGYRVLGFHSWNNAEKCEKSFKEPKTWSEKIRTYSSILLKNKKKTFAKEMSFLNQFININSFNFEIDSESYLMSNLENIPYSEYYTNVITWDVNSRAIKNSDIIAFLLALPKSSYCENLVDFEALANENIEIPKEYNFNHLIPPVEWYKEIIDEYCMVMDPKKSTPLQIQITNLTKEKQNLINEKTNLKNQLSQLQNNINSLPIKKTAT